MMQQALTIFLIFILYWSIVDVLVSDAIAKWFSYTYIYSFSESFSYRLLQNIEYSSLSYTVGPDWLFYI